MWLSPKQYKNQTNKLTLEEKNGLEEVSSHSFFLVAEDTQYHDA